MFKNVLKEKMLQGEKTLGTFHELGSATAVECLGYAGMDYVIIDTEHGPFHVESALTYIRSAKLVDLVPLVRVKDSQRNSVLKMLDVGAMGLIVPNVHTVEEVKQLISYAKYYPIGQRGVAPTVGSSFWQTDYARQGLPYYFEASNNATLLIPQCETRGCLENIEEIAALEGVDGIFIGPYDLSTALGKPGQFSDPEVSDSIEHVFGVCKKTGKFAFIYAGDEAQIKTYFEHGYDSVTYNMDALIFTQAVKEIVQRNKIT